ncbi:uncharacterized protein LOC134528394 isoform X2 [Bacillus rossius redtenbacheri]|uniref:uncharacterized protein LOC134528394 isoform X2 n=1 Tax=Bacillus rossius redtenbacheri TaxID=93214 RepID=UPI002FDE208B
MSSDDSDEDISQLKEAVDSTFLNDHLFDKSKVINANAKQESVGGGKRESAPSLRKNGEDGEQNDLRVTPEFQKFVARHLSQFIDQNLLEVEQTAAPVKGVDETESGIKLLAVSSCVLGTSREAAPESTSAQRRAASKRRGGRGASKVTREDLASVAVSPEWVLTGQGTQGWSPSTRGEVITVRAASTVSPRSSAGSTAFKQDTVEDRQQPKLVNGLEESQAGAHQSSVNGDQVVVAPFLTRPKKKKRQELVNSLEKDSNVIVQQSSVDVDQVVVAPLLTRPKKKKRRELVNSLEKDSDVGVQQSSVDVDQVVVAPLLTRPKKKKRRELVNSLEKDSDVGVQQSSVDVDQVVVAPLLTRQKKRKRQKLVNGTEEDSNIGVQVNSSVSSNYIVDSDLKRKSSKKRERQEVDSGSKNGIKIVAQVNSGATDNSVVDLDLKRKKHNMKRRQQRLCLLRSRSIPSVLHDFS